MSRPGLAHLRWVEAHLLPLVLVPTVLGSALRTWRPAPIQAIEPLLSATASLAYLALLLAVVGPNAAVVVDRPLLVAATGLPATATRWVRSG